jgi:hypothetical protein
MREGDGKRSVGIVDGTGMRRSEHPRQIAEVEASQKMDAWTPLPPSLISTFPPPPIQKRAKAPRPTFSSHQPPSPLIMGINIHDPLVEIKGTVLRPSHASRALTC